MRKIRHHSITCRQNCCKMLAALSFNLLVIGRFFTAQTGAVNSRCCIEAVANAKNWLKGGANYTGVNPCIRTEQVSRMFEAQSSRKKLYYNYEIVEQTLKKKRNL